MHGTTGAVPGEVGAVVSRQQQAQALQAVDGLAVAVVVGPGEEVVGRRVLAFVVFFPGVDVGESRRETFVWRAKGAGA